MQISENQKKAAEEIIDLIVNVVGHKRKVHPATAISAASRLSGSLLFRSFNLSLVDVNPGTTILSHEANEEGPNLINIIGSALSILGVTIDNDEMKSASIEKSEFNFLETLELTQAKALKIMEYYNLNFKDMAVACSLSTALIIKDCKNDLTVETGFNTAIFGLIEGTKTVPPPISEVKPAKKWYKFW